MNVDTRATGRHSAAAAVPRPRIVPLPPAAPALARDEEPAAGFAFGLFCILTFIMVGRPQDHIPVLGAVRPALLFTIVAAIVTVLFRKDGHRNPFRHAETKLYVGFFVGMLIGIPTSLHRTSSFEFVVLGYILSVVYFVLFVVHVNTLAKFKRIVVILVFSAFVFSVLGLLRGDFRAGRYEIAGSMFDANDVAFVELSLLPFTVSVLLGSFGRTMKGLAFVGLVSGVLLTLYTGSRGGLLGLVTFLLLFLLLRIRGVRKSGKVVMVVVLALTAAINADKINVERYSTLTELNSDYNTTEEQGRVTVWKRGLRLFANRPLTGVGADRFNEGIGTMRREEGLLPMWQAPHNSYVQVLAETGLLGAVPFLLLLVTCVTTLVRLRTRTAAMLDKTFAVIPGVFLIGFITQLLTAFFLSQAYSTFFTVSFAATAALKGIADVQKEGVSN